MDEEVKKEKKVYPKTCTFEGCGRKVIAKGLCLSHYRQDYRGSPLQPIRLMRHLVVLPMSVRVEQKTLDALQKRVDEKKVPSMYAATRQALEVGVMLLEAIDQEGEKLVSVEDACITASHPILTNEGWKKAGDVCSAQVVVKK